MSLNPVELLDLLEARAPRLRTAGVLSLTFDGVSVRFTAADPAQTSSEKIEHVAPPPIILNALDDPATFGGVLPGYQVPASSSLDDEDLLP